MITRRRTLEDILKRTTGGLVDAMVVTRMKKGKINSIARKITAVMMGC